MIGELLDHHPCPGVRCACGLAEDREQLAADAVAVAREVGLGRWARLHVWGEDFEGALRGVEADEIAVFEFADHAAVDCLGADMDRGGDFARSTRHAAIGDEGDFVAFVLQVGEDRREAMQFWHAVGFGALEADDDDGVGGELASLGGGFDGVLAVEHPGWGLDDVALGRDGGDFDNTAAEVALELFEAALGGERV